MYVAPVKCKACPALSFYYNIKGLKYSGINEISTMNSQLINAAYCFIKLGVFCISLLIQQAHAGEQLSVASADEVKQALEIFGQWIQNYRNLDYAGQYELVHPLIQHYKTRKKWEKAMQKSQQKNGELLDYEIIAAGTTTADKIPCTEMGHCYRKDIQVVLIFINSTYQKIGAKPKEYVVMAKSKQGWRFGGGTILNIPFGETMTILDRKDERRYGYKEIDTRL